MRNFSKLLSVSFSLSIIIFVQSSLIAQVQKFPYKAVVQTNQLEARSGPGRAYYATETLTQGQNVIVHRHDPGGWFQISPTSKSFSWIRADYVRKDGKSGFVIDDNVVVRVGSSLNDGMTIEQRRLKSGDRVSILGEQEFREGDRRVVMYKIKPPAQEFRWVKGDSVVPVGQAMQNQKTNDPYSNPENVIPEQKKVPSIIDGPIATYPSNNGTAKTKEVSDQQILRQLDDHFRTIIRNDVGQWNLVDIKHDYEKLQKETDSTSVAHQLNLRLAAVERYGKIKAEHDSFVQLTNETANRDAKLLQLRSQGVMVPNPDLGQPTNQPPGVGNQGTLETPAINVPGAQTPQQTDQRPPAGQMTGAGVVQRAQWRPGQVGPSHALVAPNGKLLAYLHPNQGVNLDQFIGKQMGMYGRRVNDPRIGGDVIVVENAVPVQLTQ